jgi:hypothetical protein
MVGVQVRVFVHPGFRAAWRETGGMAWIVAFAPEKYSAGVGNLPAMPDFRSGPVAIFSRHATPVSHFVFGLSFWRLSFWRLRRSYMSMDITLTFTKILEQAGLCVVLVVAPAIAGPQSNVQSESASTLSAGNRKFLNEAADGGMAELELGKLALRSLGSGWSTTIAKPTTSCGN